MTSAPRQDSRFRLGSESARELARAYGTPLYVIDESHLRQQIRRFRDASQAAWPGSRVVYASKANSTLAVLAIVFQEGCLIDAASEGELRAALLAGVPASQCHLHGNNKTRAELEYAIERGAGEIVADSFREIETLGELTRHAGSMPEFVIRLAPGVDPLTHEKISTGQADTKFGFNIADGSAEKAALRCLELGMPLAGFHCHVGSQLLDPDAQRSGGEIIARFAADMLRKHGFRARVLNVGGGLGVRYTEGDDPPEVEEYCRFVSESVREGLGDSGLAPTLFHEPGRALVAESGVTLYEVGVVKTVPIGPGTTRTYVCVDGGLSDNPRPAIYGAEYTVERVARREDAPAASSLINPSPDGESGDSRALGESGDSRSSGSSAFRESGFRQSGERSTARFTVSGRHCETDRLFPDVSLPPDVEPGDLLQVLCTGAYSSSMASNYNRYPRPATALVRTDGRHELVQEREAWDAMFARERVPGDLG